MQVTLQYAAEHLADLASAIDSGEEVEISRPEKPPLKLVVCDALAPAKRTGPPILGAGVGELRVPSFEEWQAMDESPEAPLMTPGEV
jgi:antitoxin (DNA-binding transcriptional repressor) of toxin-antitoxin stability system